MAGLGVVVECNCKQWESFAEEVFRAQVYFSQHTGNKWLGGLWSFCPWCGEKLHSAQQGHEADVLTGASAGTKKPPEPWNFGI